MYSQPRSVCKKVNLCNMAATRVEPQQSDSKYEKTHEDQQKDRVFHNGRESNRGVIFCDNKSLSKSKSSGQVNIDTDMSQYRADTGNVSVQNSANDAQKTGNTSLDSNKKHRESKSAKHNSDQCSSSDHPCTKVSDSVQNMQVYSIGLPARANIHPDHRGVGSHMHSSTESSGPVQNPFRPMNRHNLHSSKPVPNTPVQSRSVAGGSGPPPSGGVPNIQPKLFSGQSISQQTGPTPTLNQLLQSAHPLQRHQASYNEFPLQKATEQSSVNPYHQMWSPHQSSAACNPHSVCYRGPVQNPSPRGPHLVTSSPGSYSQHQQLPPGIRQEAEAASAGGGAYGVGALAPPQQGAQPYAAAGPRYPASAPTAGAPIRGEGPPFTSHSLSPPFAQPQSVAGCNYSGSNSGGSISNSGTGSASGCTPTGEQRSWSQLTHLTHQPNTASCTSGNSQHTALTSQTTHQGQTGNQHVLSSQLSPQSAPTQLSPSRSSPHQHSSHFQSSHQPPPHQIQPPHSPGSVGHGASQLSPQGSTAQRCSPQKQQHGHQVSPQVSLLRQESSNSDTPDVNDLTGQNSNDSTSGHGAPGTPNSQGMRPTPSPTGSTGSRSMSPAVGQQNIPMPPRPSSGQSDGSGPARMSHSPMATPGGYQQPLGPPHMHGAYKLGSHPPGMVPPTAQQMGPYTPPSQQYSQGNYTPRPQGQLSNMQYGPTHGYAQQNPQNNSLGASQYPNRPMPNHVPHSQFGGYQGWGSPGIGQGPPTNAVGAPGNQMPPKGPGTGTGPGTGPQPPPASTQGSNASTGPRSLTPPHYLKQHLQHKMVYGTSGSSIPPSPGSLQVGYGASPSISSSSGVNVGPNPSLGPGMGPATGIHHHGPGSMTSPMGPPASSHLHPGMGPPAPNMGPPGPSGLGPGNPGMGPPSSGSSSSANNSGPMAVSSPSAVLQGQGPSITTNAASPVPNSHHDGPMPPPISSSNSSLSHPPPSGQVSGASHPEINSISESPHDNGIATTTTVAGATATNVTPATSGTVTSVVTTGPDGTPLDEGSQQSTLSNASQASGEDQNCTPKSRKDGSVVGGYHSHPPTPQSTVPSPGAASLNSVHEEYGDVNSPSWPRTPASPKPDSLCKLYEMDESHERRMWLDKLLQFMEERGTPISACPTISKNPLDLFRLYLYVKERGGFMEVTKNKTWKDIAGLLGIGASSSAAYTLRKHYMKNLLAFECHFDRGGIDPQSIINQVEATSKKKGVKAASVPSPGSSNSQDSFPAAGSSGTSMDGFPYGYPPGSTPDFNTPPLQRPASQTNAPSPHPGVGVLTQGPGDNISVSNPFDDVGPPGQPPGQRLGLPNSYGPSYGPAGGSPRPQGIQQGYQGQGGYSQYPQDQYGRNAPSTLAQDFNQQYSQSSSYSANRAMYTPYGPDSERNYNQGSSASQPSATMQQGSSQDQYNRYMAPNQPPVYPARSGYGGPPAPPSGPTNQQQPPVAYPSQQDYYRQDQVYSAGQPPTSGGPGGQMYPSGPHNKSMPPPAPQPRRHPDFAKDQQQPPYPQYGQRQAVYGWSNNNTPYRGQFSPQGPVPQGPQQWPQGPPRPAGPPGAQAAANQWDQHRYPPSAQSAYQQPQQSQQQWVPGMATPGVGQSSTLRTSMGGPRGPYRPEGKPFSMSTPPGGKGHSGGMPVSSQYPAQSTPKREIVFPPDSVEATMPVLYKRKRMTRVDVSPVEAWRLMMSLRSGLLAESCWALDVLNILLFDDCTVAYFGLAHMPGLLDVLLEHFRRSLVDMFDAPTSTSTISATADESIDNWYHHEKMEPPDVDLGSVTTPLDPDERVCILQSTANYTLLTRKGESVKIVNKESDIFVLDNRKVWDVDGDITDENVTAELEQDQWQLATSDNSTTKYIVTCFQGEFGNVPFVRILPHKRLKNAKGDLPNLSESSDRLTELSVCEEAVSVKSIKAELEQESDNASEKSGLASKEENTNSQECLFSTTDRKNCDKKKRTNKSLIEVLSRIKKEPVEMNDILTREIREKVEKSEVVLVVKKDDANTLDITEQTEIDVENSKSKKVSDSSEDGVNGLSFENGSSSNNSNDSDKIVIEGHGTPDISSDQMLKIEEKNSLTSQPLNDFKKQMLNIRDPAGTLKRRRMSDYEDECYTRDEASLYLVTDTQDALARRCVCLSNILRNLTFVPGNEVEFAKNPTFLGLLGKLLLLHHEHPARTAKQRNYDREEDADFGDSCSSLQGESEWWWDFLHHIRENALVTAANIAGHMDLGQYPEEISRPVLDGLLHWAVCPAAHGQDPFPTVSSSLSPQRLALEALCKLCVTENNVDLVIATPPYSRLERLCAVLTKLLCRGEEQVLREFAVNLLHYLAAADSGVARTVALQSPCVSLLVAFIEQAEASALGVANQHGIGALRDNPDSMGTSLDMLRRAAGTLLHLARHPDNRPLFLQQEQRLLALVMSQILDHQVASIISRVLFQCSRSLLEHGNSYTS